MMHHVCLHLPDPVQVAQQLEAKQQEQQQAQASSERCLGQVYSLVHKLGCVARQAAAEGLLPDTAGAAGASGAVVFKRGTKGGQGVQ
jgi:hypothetical protein